MEVKQTVRSTAIQKDESPGIKLGNLVRVRVIRKVGSRTHLVEFRGNSHIALVNGNIQGKLFIAKVLKLTPRIILRYVKELSGNESAQTRGFDTVLESVKKSFIQKMITTDNLFENLLVPLQKDKKGIKESLQKSIRNQNIFQVLGKEGGLKEIIKYYTLQNINNFLDYHSSSFLFPLKIREKYHSCDLKVFSSDGGDQSSFLLTLLLENGTKIVFLVFIDYELINCTISTNSMDIENRMKSMIGDLMKSLRMLKFNKEVKVRFIPYEEAVFAKTSNMKKIDIKM
ncbi:MAG: hypothetical protein JSV25_08945 [Spirochaetota bacterium]|nr:MAG: hypothetical protein JSV25_08945 [Spirochaetota bacterium]